MEFKKYIVWAQYEYEGWWPNFFDTLEEAIQYDSSYAVNKIITRKVEYELQEKD